MTHGVDNPERDTFRLAFGQTLRSSRIAARLSQDTLAARCFLRDDHISNFERGGAPPSLDVLLLLGDALGISLEELTEGLVAPARTAGLARLLALIAERPGSDTRALAMLSELPESYVLQLLRFLLSYRQIRPQGTGWQLGLGEGERQRVVERHSARELTKRESEVLEHLRQGRSYARIALEMKISVNTVKTHAVSVRRKLNAQDKQELIGSANVSAKKALASDN